MVSYNCNNSHQIHITVERKGKMKKEYVPVTINLVKVTESDILASSETLIDVGVLFNDEKDN